MRVRQHRTSAVPKTNDIFLYVQLRDAQDSIQFREYIIVFKAFLTSLTVLELKSNFYIILTIKIESKFEWTPE